MADNRHRFLLALQKPNIAFFVHEKLGVSQSPLLPHFVPEAKPLGLREKLDFIRTDHQLFYHLRHSPAFPTCAAQVRRRDVTRQCSRPSLLRHDGASGCEHMPDSLPRLLGMAAVHLVHRRHSPLNVRMICVRQCRS